MVNVASGDSAGAVVDPIPPGNLSTFDPFSHHQKPRQGFIGRSFGGSFERWNPLMVGASEA